MKNAIVKDNLKWKYHIPQLDRFNSPLVTQYGVKEIPTKYQKHSRAAALSGIEISPTLTLYLDGRVAEIEINVSSFESQIIIIIMIIIIISNIVSHLIQKIFFLTITQMTSSQMQHLSLFLLVHWEENDTTWS